jgi:hypothetical protein
MRFWAKSIPIDSSLTPEAIDIQASGLGRYHLIKDLALKGSDQIACFHQRIEEIHNLPERIQLSLITVIAEHDSHFKHSQTLPLFDFIGIHTNTFAAYGVMFSTYLHDLDRAAINQDNLPMVGSTSRQIARLLVDSLFFPTCCNNNQPPFPDQTPVFIFPESRTTSQDGTASSTDRYMAQLGFRASRYSRHNNTGGLRVFSHDKAGQPFDCRSMNPAILAVGQACVEMTEDLAPTPGMCLKPFDRSGLTIEVKTDQARIAQHWLMRNLKNLIPGCQGTSERSGFGECRKNDGASSEP